MLKKILIANRGEIAVRIIEACHELGIKTVAVFSEVDKDALHVQLADESYCIGPALASESYLHMEKMLQIATTAQVDAIHPGYGFLAENADFALLCEQFGITFIGPSSEAIRRMGTKDIARQTMSEAGVPITPGSNGLIHNFEEALAIATEIDYPVLLKATAGGGGKGIRLAHNEEELRIGLERTKEEARIAFGNDGVYLEKFMRDFRHIEIQIVADAYGNTIHFGERDCTIQRRMQKLIEETPSPAITPEIREKMGKAAVQAAQSVNYVGAGTVEFIYERATNQFYFMEMNTRIQVEHTITEMVTGVDLVQLQLLIASGMRLPYSQKDIQLSGWAIECRINAEDPDNQFMPSPGKISSYMPPGGYGVRVDSAIYSGYTIQPYYDPLVAKLIVHSTDRQAAIQKMIRALDHYSIDGIKTTIPFYRNILEDDIFQQGEYNTNFLEKYEQKQTKV